MPTFKVSMVFEGIGDFAVVGGMGFLATRLEDIEVVVEAKDKEEAIQKAKKKAYEIIEKERSENPFSRFRQKSSWRFHKVKKVELLRREVQR